ncbi:MAG TPA: 50S ribosomal protein L25 [Flavilitoribacter sp.]|nr:50S ribosomal protein L25 [Flavilitoribacter sp.]HMQ88496.1 50S ribosomal protein L25 [Flavilitoribacter sp.]
MKELVAIKGEPRADLGKKGAKAVRTEGKIPCVLYGHDVVVHFSVNPPDIKNLVYTSDFNLAEVEVDGKKFKCYLKDKQFHPLTDAILHLDFLTLSEGQKIKVEVPVRFSGQAKGVKVGGKLQQSLRTVKIKTTPEHLIDEVIVDVSHLELGQSIRVRDIKAIDGVEIMNSPGIPLATIEIPRALRSAAAAAEKS